MHNQTPEEIRRVANSWAFWARDEQKPPPGDWRIWLFLGGRGAGKTRAGAEWIRAQVIAGRRRIALVAPTFSDVREVMVSGPSGFLNIGEADERPRYEASRHRLIWPNGAEAHGFSSEDPDGLRGPQFDCAWVDEFAAWTRPQETLDMLGLGLRLGEDPRLMITTTPRPIPALKALLKQAGVVMTHAATQANAANLAPGFVAAMTDRYGASRLARQELEGVLIDDPDGALWTRDLIDQALGLPAFEPERVVVAVDPPASATGDECGIIAAGVAGLGRDARLVVLKDMSLQARPEVWAARVAEAFDAVDADWVVAEANQGGEMVRSVLGQADCPAPVALVHARRSKAARAEPVALLYEQGRVVHCGDFPALEEEMLALGCEGGPSPDRADALVWGVSRLMLEPQGEGPWIRRL